MDVRTRATMGKSLLYDIYYFLQNCVSTKEMIEMLTVAYEETDEVNASRENSINRKYEHLIAYWNETLTQTYNHFRFSR